MIWGWPLFWEPPFQDFNSRHATPCAYVCCTTKKRWPFRRSKRSREALGGDLAKWVIWGIVWIVTVDRCISIVYSTMLWWYVRVTVRACIRIYIYIYTHGYTHVNLYYICGQVAGSGNTTRSTHTQRQHRNSSCEKEPEDPEIQTTWVCGMLCFILCIASWRRQHDNFTYWYYTFFVLKLVVKFTCILGISFITFLVMTTSGR